MIEPKDRSRRGPQMSATPDSTSDDPQQIIADLRRRLAKREAELAERNSAYGERIEQQTATADVLRAMSASPGDAQPVFQLIVERARAFCNANNANLALVDHDMLHLQASTIGFQDGLDRYSAQ